MASDSFKSSVIAAEQERKRMSEARSAELVLATRKQRKRLQREVVWAD